MHLAPWNPGNPGYLQCADSWPGKDSDARSQDASLVGSKCLSGCSYRKRAETGAGGGAVRRAVEAVVWTSAR